MSRKLGRNDPCHCGSGKKYKRCCLDKDAPRILPTSPNPVFPFAPPASRSNEPVIDAGELKALFAPPQGPPDPWYDRYTAADAGKKKEMLLALLHAGHSVAYYEEEGFVDSVLEFEGCLEPEEHDQYVVLLEDILTERPDVFRLGGDYFVRDMAYAYVNSGCGPKFAEALDLLVQASASIGEPVFDLLDLLRLAGMEEEARTLVFAIVSEGAYGDLLPWAVDELIGVAFAFLLLEHLEKGNGPEFSDDLRRQLSDIGCEPNESVVLEVLAHRAGAIECEPQSTDLREGNDSADFNLFLLSLDFGRWLTTSRKMAPVTAEAWRDFVYICLSEMKQGGRTDPLVIRKKKLTKYVSSLIGFITLNQLRAMATVIALPAFYDFLLTKGFIRWGQFGRAIEIIGDLRSEISPYLDDPRWPYGFLHRYERESSQTDPRREKDHAATA